MTFELKPYVERWRKEVDRVLEEVLPSGPDVPESLAAAMHYSLFAGGKRFRPVLCVAGCETVNANPKLALRAAAALEMVHTYSLIHDDLPAMDDDKLRRGQPTCHIKFGEATAILAGDALLTEAFGVIVRDPDLDPWLKNVVVAELVKAAGAGGMVAGQVADMEAEGKKVNEDQVDFIHEHKTAAMIAASVVIGGIIGNGSEAEIDDLRKYGRYLGLAFQITDDILNVTGGKALGKGVGTDSERGKATYPALLGLEESKMQAKEMIRRAVQALQGFGDNARALRALADYVNKREN